MSDPAPTSPSASKAAAPANPPTPGPRGKDWADDDDSDSGDELRKQFGMDKKKGDRPAALGDGAGEREKSPEPQKDDKPVASLLSRIGGLATSDDESTPSSPSTRPPKSAQAPSAAPRERPKANTANPLFGRALASATANRQTSATSTSTPTASSSTSAQTAKAGDDNKTEATDPTISPVKAKATLVSAPSDSQKGKELFPTETPKTAAGTMAAVMDDGWGSGPAQTTEPNSGWGNAKAQPAPPSNGKSAADDIGWEPAAKDDDGQNGDSGLIQNEFEVEIKLADLQADPNSPLYSVKNFEDLPIHPDLLKGIYAVGFKKPSKIQERALPMLLMNPPRNLIGQSQSGTGKTAAFVLNMLSRVDPGIDEPQAICLAPSRELARQIQEVVEAIGQFTPIKCMLAVPGSWSRSARITKQILIGTPGTVVDMISRGGRIFDPRKIRVFVLDEADEMVALQGQGDQTVRIKKTLSPGVQNVLFSATFSDEVRQFAESFAPESNQMFLKKEEVTVDAIKQLYLECDGEEQKYNALAALYDCMSIGQSIVFCRRRDTADRIAQRLTDEGHSVASLHGDKMTTDRDAILDGFRNGKTKVLITTNVIARGIDILQVNMVVNYDVPDTGADGGFRPDIETYIHRIGRTGRFGRKGCSVTFVHDRRSHDDVQEIMRQLGKPMKRIDATSHTDLEDLEKALKLAMKGVEK